MNPSTCGLLKSFMQTHMPDSAHAVPERGTENLPIVHFVPSPYRLILPPFGALFFFIPFLGAIFSQEPPAFSLCSPLFLLAAAGGLFPFPKPFLVPQFICPIFPAFFATRNPPIPFFSTRKGSGGSISQKRAFHLRHSGPLRSAQNQAKQAPQRPPPCGSPPYGGQEKHPAFSPCSAFFVFVLSFAALAAVIGSC